MEFSKLTQPDQRKILARIVFDLSRIGSISGENSPYEEYEFGYAINFLFDDTGIGEDPSKYIGSVFNNEAESNMTKNLISKIDQILNKYGASNPDRIYVGTSEWKDIVDSARELYQILSDEP